MSTTEKEKQQSAADILNSMSSAQFKKGGKIDVSGMVSESAILENNKINWKAVDTEIVRKGSAITLPDDPGPMPIKDAIRALKRREDEENEDVSIVEEVDCFPLDGAVAFMVALRIKFGWASPVPTPGFFGPRPPQMRRVELGDGESIEVPWGEFKIPGLDEGGRVIVTDHHGRFGYSFAIHALVKKKQSGIIREIAELTREIVSKYSIYKGKAIRVRASGSSLDVDSPPEFLDLKHVDPDMLVLPKDTEDAVRVNIFSLLQHTDDCRKAKIPLKRGVLLAGSYGTGKTLTAMVTARHAVDNRWTFITLDDCRALRATLEFARRYQPCVIFAEDVDRAMGTRDDAANDILNTLDGAISKNAEIMVVLTTNHLDRITQAMLRPGRLDAILRIPPPDAEAVGRLIRQYAGGKLDPKADITEACDLLSGSIPAMIREVVERSKLAMISRGGKKVEGSDIAITARSIKEHQELLKPAGKEMDPYQKLGKAVYDALGSASKDAVQAMTRIQNEGLADVRDYDHVSNDRALVNLREVQQENAPKLGDVKVD